MKTSAARTAVHFGLVAALLAGFSTASFAHGGTIAGIATTALKGLRPLRVTMDMKVCGAEVPNETIAVAADGGLANVVVTLTGVKVMSSYSYRSASIGSRRLAFNAGQKPKRMPTAAENTKASTMAEVFTTTGQPANVPTSR